MKILAKYNKEGNYIDTVDIDQYNEQIAANHEAILSAGEITAFCNRKIVRAVCLISLTDMEAAFFRAATQPFSLIFRRSTADHNATDMFFGTTLSL